MDTIKIIIGIGLGIGIVAAAYALLAFVFQLLWNFVIPNVFSLPTLSFWEAGAIVLILGFFGGFIKGSK